MGSVPGALGGLNLGGLDLSSMLSNPALMNMVRSAPLLSLFFILQRLKRYGYMHDNLKQYLTCIIISDSECMLLCVLL